MCIPTESVYTGKHVRDSHGVKTAEEATVQRVLCRAFLVNEAVFISEQLQKPTTQQ